MREIIIKGKRFLNKLKEDHVSESAAECAYYTILSFVPFLNILLIARNLHNIFYVFKK